jgi:hypothetical protein
MNTKATAPAASNSTGPTTAAPKMTMDEQLALATRVMSGKASAEEKKKFLDLAQQNEKAEEGRKGHLDTIRTALETLAGHKPIEVSEVVTLFGTQLMSDVAHHLGLVQTIGAKKSGNKKEKAAGTSSTGTSFPSKEANVIMFQFPGGDSGKAPSPYYKGRAYESVTEVVDGKAKVHSLSEIQPNQKKLPWSIFANAQTVPMGLMKFIDESNYKFYIPEENKKVIEDYLKTPEGKKELELVLEEASKGRKAKKVALVPHPDNKAKAA